MKLKYKFSHSDGNQYHWYSVDPISGVESRHEHITVGIDWFWKTAKYGGHEACS